MYNIDMWYGPSGADTQSMCGAERITS